MDNIKNSKLQEAIYLLSKKLETGELIVKDGIIVNPKNRDMDFYYEIEELDERLNYYGD